MNENQKLSQFMDAIHQEAEKRQNKINQETEAFKKAELAKIKQQARAEVDEIIRKRTEEIMIESGKAISAHRQENIKRLLLRRNEIMSDIFSEVEDRVLIFAATEGYLKKVEQDIESVRDRLDGAITVLIKKADRSESLCKKLITQAKIEYDSSIRLGGIIIVLEDKRKRLDFTFDSLLEEEKEKFREIDELKISI